MNLSMERNTGYKVILKNTQYLKLIIAKLISRFGDSIDFIAYSWMVYELTGSKLMIATLYSVNALPNIIFGLLSGPTVNYFKKKNIILICDVGRGLVVLITALMFITGNLKPWNLYVFTFINSSFESFRSPANTSLFSLIVNKNCFDYALSLDTSLSRIIEIVGFGVAGLLISLLGVGGVITVDAITFFICGFIIFTIKCDNEIVKKESLTLKSYSCDLKEGLKYIKNNSLIKNIIAFGALVTLFFIPFNTMQAAYVKEVIKKGPEGLTVFAISFLVSIIATSTIVPKIRGKIKGKPLFIISGVILGLGYILLASLQNFTDKSYLYILLVIICMFMGAAIPFLQIVIQTAFYTNVEQEYISRVSSVMDAAIMGATPLGGVIVGFIANKFTLVQVYTYVGICIILIYLTQIFNKQLRNL